MSESSALPFTGERFTPECVREIWYEHWHRYAFARTFAADKRVVDVACGEGYGSALLAREAREVIGIDINGPAIAHARARYAGITNLRFEQGDATALTLPDASCDLLVSFETLEHVDAHEQLIAGFARTLTSEGLLIISSPDKRVYTELSGFHNEHHVRELYRDELLALLAPHFPHVRLYGQKLLFQSTIWSLDANGENSIAMATADARGSVESGLQYDPLYFLAVCSKQRLGALPTVALFGDREESVYRHYDHEVRKNIAAGGRIVELESEVAALRAELDRLQK